MTRNTISRSSRRRWRSAAVHIPLVLGWLTLSSVALAVCQDGCFFPDNTALGEDALLVNSGTTNTAVGSNALNHNATGDGNTAVGAFALTNGTTASGNTAIGFNALVSN